MTFTDAAAEVLRLVGRPLHYKEITDFAIEKNLLSHVGKSPEVTMGARLAALLKKDSPESQLIRVKPGVFALREWDDKTIKTGLDIKGPAAAAPHGSSGEGAGEAHAEAEDARVAPLDPDDEPLIGTADDDDEEAARVTLIPKAKPPHAAAHGQPRAPRAQAAPVIDDDDVIDGPEDVMRAELVAAAAEVFDEEDDDDQPILGGEPSESTPEAGQGQDGRRRRRRRRRGRGGAAETSTGGGNGGLPSYTAVPVDDRRHQAHNGRRDESGGDSRRDETRSDERGGREVIDFLATQGPQLDDLTGRDFADAVYSILANFDRAAGPASLRQIAETVQRKGRLAGDVQAAQSQVAAAVRADNQRRIANGQRPRFRFAGGRVGLTDWLLGSELASLEHEAIQAVERYRDAARRAFARKIGELPGHAFVELAVLLLERIGVRELRAIRRAGAPGGESHFSAALRTPLDTVRVGIVIRRDGREVGRERVTELRGALHHYAGARMGFIFTAGQVLSGAREEAATPSVEPIALQDGIGVAKLCEEHDVAVIRARMPIAIPDVDLLEALRAS